VDVCGKVVVVGGTVVCGMVVGETVVEGVSKAAFLIVLF
jgi:hypothetical protein